MELHDPTLGRGSRMGQCFTREFSRTVTAGWSWPHAVRTRVALHRTGQRAVVDFVDNHAKS